MGKVHQATTDIPHENITIRVPKEWWADLESWRQSQPVPPKRSDVIKLAVTQFINRQNAEQTARRRGP